MSKPCEASGGVTETLVPVRVRGTALLLFLGTGNHTPICVHQPLPPSPHPYCSVALPRHVKQSPSVQCGSTTGGTTRPVPLPNTLLQQGQRAAAVASLSATGVAATRGLCPYSCPYPLSCLCPCPLPLPLPHSHPLLPFARSRTPAPRPLPALRYGSWSSRRTSITVGRTTSSRTFTTTTTSTSRY